MNLYSMILKAKRKMNDAIRVEVKKDHLDKVSRGSALQAVAELVWNAFDADADIVEVTVDRDDFGLRGITVKDNGYGIEYSKVRQFFSSLGGSWKSQNGISPKGRFLHGKEGQGRFKSFSIGRVVEWETDFIDDSGELLSYAIKGKADDKRVFHPTVPCVSNSESSGTSVSIFEPHKEFTTIQTDRLITFFSTTISLSQGSIIC